MGKRFVSIWFRYLTTDWFALRMPELVKIPFVLTAPSHGRVIITAANILAEKEGIYAGMVAADARVIIPTLKMLDDKPGLSIQLLEKIAAWCIRFTPYACINDPDGILLDCTGCTHLWGSDEKYINDITKKISARGYHVRMAMSDTIGSAWALARYGKSSLIIPPGKHTDAILSLPAAALRLEDETIERLNKLGLKKIKDFISMPIPSLRRRFGEGLIKRIRQALGKEEEIIDPVIPVEPYHERLPCLEPIATRTGIDIALQKLLTSLCDRLKAEQKGLRIAVFTCYRVDGKVIQLTISTNRPSHHAEHLFKLFEIKIQSIEPDLGIELFVLEAKKVEDHFHVQENIWEGNIGLTHHTLAELLDRVEGKIGPDKIHRYLPAEHYWPERSIVPASSLDEKLPSVWKTDRPRPVQLLSNPERIEVTAPIPDYPPMLFRYKGKIHKIIKADGPERIEQEWWIEEGRHRDYYVVEDENGHRYWLFRSGHYTADNSYQWFIHGFFA